MKPKPGEQDHCKWATLSVTGNHALKMPQDTFLFFSSLFSKDTAFCFKEMVTVVLRSPNTYANIDFRGHR